MQIQDKQTQARPHGSRRARRYTRQPENILGVLLWGGLFTVLFTLGS